MYFFRCEETRRFVSIFKNIDAMLLNLDPDIVHSGPRLHSTCSKQHGQFLNRRKENLWIYHYYIDSCELQNFPSFGTCFINIIRDRPFNLKRVYCFVLKHELEYLFFLSRIARIFFPEFNIRLYDKNSESDYFLFPPPKSEYFFQQNWESEYFFKNDIYRSL
jgi:hypothetical protein